MKHNWTHKGQGIGPPASETHLNSQQPLHQKRTIAPVLPSILQNSYFTII